MSLYSKKLHIMKNNVQEDINLYTTIDEVGNPYLSLQDETTTIYAKLATTAGSSMHVNKTGTIYNVIKEATAACPTGSIEP